MALLSPRAYARLPTEQPNPRTRDIDLRSTREIVRLIVAEDARVPSAVAKVAGEVARGVDALAATLARGGSVLVLGAGTSGRLAVLEAAECPPTFNTTARQVRAEIAGGRRSVFRAKEGAEDEPALGRKAASKVRRGDSVVGVAASGVTPFVRAALDEARRRGASTLLVTSNGRPHGVRADIVIAPDVGPEVVTGSTRLKSGTAAKLVLNALTTGAMIRIGKVYDHWMVDLKPTSRKLRLRGERIVADLGRVAPARASALFRASGGSVKTAVLMARRGLSAEEARSALERAGGALRRALEKK
ncbi:MAG TPA: N-acetylmuramic acid 6-phosphate etherase [Elusimicrobiota bacterium]|nr:N-acetylmuramic acid 6-phosphate etherase [Elusimicrobiota bacterium]